MPGLQEEHGRSGVPLFHGLAIQHVVQAAALILAATVKGFLKLGRLIHPPAERFHVHAPLVPGYGDSEEAPEIREEQRDIVVSK